MIIVATIGLIVVLLLAVLVPMNYAINHSSVFESGELSRTAIKLFIMSPLLLITVQLVINEAWEIPLSGVTVDSFEYLIALIYLLVYVVAFLFSLTAAVSVRRSLSDANA
jgi:hypothetical protein